MEVDEFIARWTQGKGGAERANYVLFLSELCDLIDVARPNPAGPERGFNDYVFERAVKPRLSEATTAPKRIDLYKKNAFILEAKQSRLPGQKNALPGQTSLFPDEALDLGRRDAARGWDVMMQNARKQAEGYVFLLDADQPAPPFIVTCDVGHCLELYADFSGSGRAYDQFPDRAGFRVFMDDLRDPLIRERLAKVWTDPWSLDPAKTSARVTREIAKRLAEVSKALEHHEANPEDVANFLMRCLFTMFAEDTDLLPKGSFQTLLEKSVEDPRHFPRRLKALWQDMEKGADFSLAIEARVRHFNGGLFKDTTVFELGKGEIGELLAAARAGWKQVDPAIFGTLLEQALSPAERKKLGAHYTPRAYVQRLVDVTVMEPLRADWQAALTRAESAKEDGKTADAIAHVRAFHHQLCATRILDPACGTGNFLYVALELMKKLEGDVLQTLSDLGDRNAGFAEMGESIDPHQFLGLELNPRAAAIAELVIWIGYLQWHYRNFTSHPTEPILKAFQNINFGRREGYDAVLTWDGYPLPGVEMKYGKRVETYPNARRPAWPEAEFIVGNPPFIGNKRMITQLGEAYVSSLRAAWSDIPESADLVMYWWYRAAELTAKGGARRFGLVTTNSITMTFNRVIIERFLTTKPPLSLVYAIPDHPWSDLEGSAAVRIAMTVGVAGSVPGVVHTVRNVRHGQAGSDELNLPDIGKINSFLGTGVSLDQKKILLSNSELSFMGVIPVSLNFVVSESEINFLGFEIDQLPSTIKKYIAGKALADNKGHRYIVDFFGLEENESRNKYPSLYQYVLENVKPFRDSVNRKNHREKWWLFGEARPGMRHALSSLNRYVATTETSKHRWFTMLPTDILPDQKIRVVATSDYAILAAMSSRFHVVWATATGGRVGKGNDPVYNNTVCFDPFPFPDTNDAHVVDLRALGEELDATRKRVQADHPDLTLTGLYNVLEKIKSGAALTDSDEGVKQRGLVLILAELHDRIDALTAAAYGWPADLTDEQILERLVALNAERAAEEATGQVRWLRPDYQIPRFAKGAAARSGELALGEMVIAIDKALPAFPTDRYEQPLAIEALLAAADRPMTAAELARGFKRGGKRIEARVAQALITLTRYGRLSASAGGAYTARRAA